MLACQVVAVIFIGRGEEHRQTFCRNKQALRCCSVLMMETGPTLCSLQGAKFEKFPSKFSNFFLKFANCSGDFWPNLNQSVQYFGAKQMSHTQETQLGQNLNQTFLKPPNFRANFLFKFIFGQIRTDQKFGGNSGPT